MWLSILLSAAAWSSERIERCDFVGTLVVPSAGQSTTTAIQPVVVYDTLVFSDGCPQDAIRLSLLGGDDGGEVAGDVVCTANSVRFVPAAPLQESRAYVVNAATLSLHDLYSPHSTVESRMFWTSADVFGSDEEVGEVTDTIAYLNLDRTLDRLVVVADPWQSQTFEASIGGTVVSGPVDIPGLQFIDAKSSPECPWARGPKLPAGLDPFDVVLINQAGKRAAITTIEPDVHPFGCAHVSQVGWLVLTVAGFAFRQRRDSRS